VSFAILTVCLGNVCRSPQAELLLAARLRAHGVEPDVSSAGARALVGRAVDPSSAAELDARGVVHDTFAARQLTPALVQPAALVLTATRDLRSRVLEEVPGALRRTFTLREFAAHCARLVPADGSAYADPRELVAQAAAQRGSVVLDDPDVPDPIGRSEETHALVATLIDDAVSTIATALVRSGLQ
jgi:protein-tyrosine phosphatase